VALPGYSRGVGVQHDLDIEVERSLLMLELEFGP